MPQEIKFESYSNNTVREVNLTPEETREVQTLNSRLVALKNLIREFGPNDNTASLIISFEDFLKFLNYTGQPYDFLNLY